MKLKHKNTHRYAIVMERNFTVIRTFATKSECRDFIMRGLSITEGSEREHYVSMLAQLDNGRRSLVY